MPRSPSKPSQQVGSSPDPATGYALLPVHVQRDGAASDTQDCVAEETPVALIVNGQPHVVMMVTPGDLEDFALGFCLSEAIVTAASEMESLTVNAVDNGYEIGLRIPAARAALLADRRRNLVGRSGCGLCGSETIAEAMRPAPHVPAGLPISTAALHRALHELRDRQPINAVTGATHAAAWADVSGKLLLVREDVGRHNALDKLIGAMSRGQVDSARGFAVITSRASYEMVLKAATVGMPLLAAISAPTALAVRMAEEAGLSLIGYARGGNHVIYACPARLGDTALLPTPTEPVSA